MLRKSQKDDNVKAGQHKKLSSQSDKTNFHLQVAEIWASACQQANLQVGGGQIIRQL